MLVRYFLEKCRTLEEILEKIKNLPIASAQTITLKVKIIFPEKNKNFVVPANNFNSWEMKEYKNSKDLDSEERYKTAYTALKENKDCFFEFALNLLFGKYVSMIQIQFGHQFIFQQKKILQRKNSEQIKD